MQFEGIMVRVKMYCQLATVRELGAYWLDGYPGQRKSTCCQGRLHMGGMVRDAPWRKLGGDCDDNDAFARVYNNLLLYESIYYLTPVHF